MGKGYGQFSEKEIHLAIKHMNILLKLTHKKDSK